MDRRIPKVEKKSCEVYLESLRNSIILATETNELAQNTSHELLMQSEQIEGIKHKTELISFNLDTSEYLLGGMKSAWKSFLHMFNFSDDSKNLAVSNRNNNNYNNMSEYRCPYDSVEDDCITTADQQKDIKRLEGRECIEENLDYLSSLLDDIHDRTREMNSTIKQQNNILSCISEQIVRNSDRLKKQQEDMNYLLR